MEEKYHQSFVLVSSINTSLVPFILDARLISMLVPRFSYPLHLQMVVILQPASRRPFSMLPVMTFTAMMNNCQQDAKAPLKGLCNVLWFSLSNYLVNVKYVSSNITLISSLSIHSGIDSGGSNYQRVKRHLVNRVTSCLFSFVVEFANNGFNGGGESKTVAPSSVFCGEMQR